MPYLSGQSSISRVNPSAIIRNASGEKGQPCGTPQWMVNCLDRVPFTLTLLLGGEWGFESIVARVMKCVPKLSASNALW
jgi:hypothetical protein